MPTNNQPETSDDLPLAASTLLAALQDAEQRGEKLVAAFVNALSESFPDYLEHANGL